MSHSFRHTCAHRPRVTAHSCPQKPDRGGRTPTQGPTQVPPCLGSLHRRMSAHPGKHWPPSPAQHTQVSPHIPHKPAPGHRGPHTGSRGHICPPEACRHTRRTTPPPAHAGLHVHTALDSPRRRLPPTRPQSPDTHPLANNSAVLRRDHTFCPLPASAAQTRRQPPARTRAQRGAQRP